MDLPPQSASENIPEMTGARFTVRSANSPSYSLTRRPGLKKKPVVDNAEDTRCSNIRGDIGAGNHIELNQNGTAERKHQNQCGIDVAELHGKGSTEQRQCNPLSRSMSLDWRSGERNLPSRTRAGVSKLLNKSKAGSFEEQMKEKENNMPRGGTLFLKDFKSTGSRWIEDSSSVNQGDITHRAKKVNTLPLRFKTESGHGLKLECQSGPQGGGSIKKRIQKLFESAGKVKAVGTFPRRFSFGEEYNPVQKTMPSFWGPKQANPTRTEPSATPTAAERSTEIQRHGQFANMHLKEGRWKRDTIEIGTKSLDRARSRFTAAVQIRSARTATGISQPQTLVGDTLPVFKQRRPSLHQEHSSSDMTEIIKVQEYSTERDEETKQQTELRRGIADEDVFDTNPGKCTLQSSERNKLPEILSTPLSASVRNKINQFEALTQKATSFTQIQRRTFSVPADLCEAQEGVKKSGSAKYIGEKDYNREMKTTGRTEKRKITGSERSFSVDEVGFRFGNSETDGSNLLEKSINEISEDIGKYSSLKKTLHIPLNEGSERLRNLFYLDKTDCVKDSSPKGSNLKANVQLKLIVGMHSMPQCEISSPLSDDDKTPINTPLNTSPFLSPVKDPEDIFSTADNESFTLIAHDKIKDIDSTPPTPSHNIKSDLITKNEDSKHLPPGTYFQNNSLDVFGPDGRKELPKGRRQLSDLKAWIASLDPEYKDWNNSVESEDDDESTQKDSDSDCDFDCGDSSITMTSNISQSENRSFSLSLSDLCNFSGADYESDNDSDDWQLAGRRSASLSSDVSAFSCVSLLPSEEIDKLVEDVKHLGDETLQDYDDVQVVVLHKEVGVGLGFSLAGGVDQNKPITVHKVFNSGVAAQEGSIKEGHFVLSINGTALSESGHWEALGTLRRAKSKEMAVVVLRKVDLSCVTKLEVQKDNETETTTQYETGQDVYVQLEMNSRNLGFSLQGGVASCEGNRPLTVKKIFHGGPVDKVFPGDVILEIQGTSVVGMRRLEVWTFIKTLPSGPVDVLLRRPLKVTQL